MLTNKPKEGRGPDFPENFRAACLIHGLPQASVLQHFIDHVLVCASFNTPDKVYDAFPVAVVHQYVDTCGTSLMTLKNPRKRQESIRSLRQIAGIAGSDTLGQAAKWKACNGVVDRWQNAILDSGSPPGQLLLSGDMKLRLSPDLRLLCEVFQLDPGEIVYFFACQISLPWAKAQIRSNFDATLNPAMAFFTAVIKGETGLLNKNKELTHPGISLDYLEKLQELDLRLRFDRNVERREQVYRKLYDEWYNTLVQQTKPIS